MNYFNRAIQQIGHFQKLERFLAITLTSIPGILWIVDNQLRESISEYVMMSRNYVFGSLLTIAAMFYIFTGVLYYKDSNHNHKGQLYNVILGILLLGVVFVPCNELPKLHYVVAIPFFALNAFIIPFKSSRLNRSKNIIIAILVLLPFLMLFVLNQLGYEEYTLFWAEWISLVVIATHLYYESLGDQSHHDKNSI